MTLQAIEQGAPAIPFLQLGGNRALTLEVQTRLGVLGLLDPPADGQFGPVSHWALGQFLRRVHLDKKSALDAEVAATLREAPSDLYPVRPAKTLAGKIVAGLTKNGHWINRHPDCVNIVYVEGMDVDGKRNDDAPNSFNDLRVVLRIGRTGKPTIVEAWEGTTEPGRFFTVGPERNRDGAARIAFGQYKSWAVGTHRAGAPSAHEALVQVAPVEIFRDLNADFERAGDERFTGVFQINQHWGFDLPKTDIRNASAGCLVGRTKSGHRAFMALCKSDPRYQTSNGYRFMTSVLQATDVLG